MTTQKPKNETAISESISSYCSDPYEVEFKETLHRTYSADP